MKVMHLHASQLCRLQILLVLSVFSFVNQPVDCFKLGGHCFKLMVVCILSLAPAPRSREVSEEPFLRRNTAEVCLCVRFC